MTTVRGLLDINKVITDRSDCFYWQTDRAIDPAEAGMIFADRHAGVSEAELEAAASEALGQSVKLVSREKAAQNDLGNVNIVRELRGKDDDFIIRAHPKGLLNGYFWAEAEAAKALREAGLPGYKTYKVQDIDSDHPFAFMIIEKLPGTAVKIYLEQNPAAEVTFTHAAGVMMAHMHQIHIDGFGFLDNAAAKTGTLQGIKTSFRQHVLAGLDFNLQVLQDEKMLSAAEAAILKNYFENSALPNIKQGVLVHNDFADWNLLTDGVDVTGILDLDEAFSGDPVADLACWTTFHGMERFQEFLKGYTTVTRLPSDSDQRFWFYRLRYLVSKLTLRIRRLTWDHSPYRTVLLEKIASGRTDLEEALTKLNL